MTQTTVINPLQEALLGIVPAELRDEFEAIVVELRRCETDITELCARAMRFKEQVRPFGAEIEEGLVSFLDNPDIELRDGVGQIADVWTGASRIHDTLMALSECLRISAESRTVHQFDADIRDYGFAEEEADNPMRARWERNQLHPPAPSIARSHRRIAE